MKMRAVQVTRPTGPLDIVEREIPEPAAGQVRVDSEPPFDIDPGMCPAANAWTGLASMTAPPAATCRSTSSGCSWGRWGSES